MVSGPSRRPSDARILAVLFRRYRRPLSRWLRRHGRTPQQIDDFVQETFTRIMSRGALCEVNHWRAYLFQTLRNLVVERQEDAQRARAILTYDSSEVETQADRVPDGTEVEEDVAIEQALAVALSKLPRRWADAIRLHQDGLSDAEVASALGVSVGAARQYLMQARRRLQDELWPQGQGRRPT